MKQVGNGIYRFAGLLHMCAAADYQIWLGEASVNNAFRDETLGRSKG